MVVYRKSKTFQDRFEVSIEANHFFINTDSGRKGWAWREFSTYYETPGFFHLYFDRKTFFLIPKNVFENDESVDEARKIIKEAFAEKDL